MTNNKTEEPGTQFVQSNGIRMAYQQFGDDDAPVVLLIAGLYNQLIRWPIELCELLVERGFRVIRFDNRDIGLTDKMEGEVAPSFFRLGLNSLFGLPVKVPYSLNDMAADTVGLLDALDIKAAHIVGMSMGGMISQLVAGLYPTRALSLTSIMSKTGAFGNGGASLAVARQMVKPIPKGTSALDNSVKTRQMFGSPGYLESDEDVAIDVKAEFKRSNNPAGYLRQLAAIRSAPSRNGLLNTLKIPVLIIHGNQDLLVNVSGAIATKQQVPHAKLVRFEGMGHTLPQPLLAEFADLIQQTANSASTGSQ
ncbi:MAG: alpha/beta hydrolase [Porticoccaceae bacterium]|nr:alpha/beta hydrolase [Porticoccaceae bacterium]